MAGEDGNMPDQIVGEEASKEIGHKVNGTSINVKEETRLNGDISDIEGSDADAEGEEVDYEEFGETVGAVKIPDKESLGSREDDTALLDTSSEEGDFNNDEDDGSENSSSESEAEAEWEAESDAAEEAETGVVDPNRCIFCGEDEEHDPSEEFEEYLACAVCGDNAHRQCARSADCLSPDDDAQHWRCTTCIENGLEEDTKDTAGTSSRRRSSAPKIARDLLPSHRGALKPDSHSVFNTLILDDDPMDGSRSLRKRKASSDELDHLQRVGKRRRDSGDMSSSDEELNSSRVPHSSERPAAIGALEAAETNDMASAGEGSQKLRSSRRQRSRKSEKVPFRVVKAAAGSLVISIQLDAAKMVRILSRKPKPKRVRERERTRKVQPLPEPVPHYPALRAADFAAPLYSFQEREQDDFKLKPYGGILNETDADTSKTYPQAVDRKRFEDARQKAEEDWKIKTAALNGAGDAVRPVNKASGPPSKIKCVSFGGYEIDTWHAAPYPEEYSRNRVLYICEFCLKYMSSDYVAWRHKLKCPAKHPPGDEIYRDGPFSFFEVDGRKNPVYCQNLCLLAKLFLGSKTLYYDVEPFLFYVMTENDEFGCHFVGYFSKEKRPSSLNNVSCILVLPIHQRRGFGHFLIDFSYLLTRMEKKAGSPEKPLSDMGLVSYRSYWRLVLCYQLVNQKTPISISQLSEQTGMTVDDIISALEGLRALVKDPETGVYALRLDYAYFREYIENYERKGYSKLNPDALVWTPYVMGRTNLSHYEDGPPLQTMAPREEEDSGETPEEGVQMAKEESMTNSMSLKGGMSSKPDDLTPKDEVDKFLSGSAVQSPSATHPSTPKVNGDSIPPDAIPPWRFQVWPPVPGTTPRRRPGRPFGSRGRRTGTPVRRNQHLRSPGTIRPTSGRRTRSKLGEVLNGLGINGDKEGHEQQLPAAAGDESAGEALGRDEPVSNNMSQSVENNVHDGVRDS